MDDGMFLLTGVSDPDRRPTLDPALGDVDRQRLQAEIGRLRDQVADLTAKTVNIEAGLQSSREIGAALGIVMATHRVTNERAFDLLTELSQQTNRKLRDIAADIVFTGALPLEPAHGAGNRSGSPLCVSGAASVASPEL